LNLGPVGILGMGVVSTLSIMPYSIASLGSIHLLRLSSRTTYTRQHSKVYTQRQRQQDTLIDFPDSMTMQQTSPGPATCGG
jgi:hypothetical protein